MISYLPNTTNNTLYIVHWPTLLPHSLNSYIIHQRWLTTAILSLIIFCSQVMLAVGICTIVTLGLTIFAFQTKIDFTVMGGFLFVAVLILFVFGIIAMFFKGPMIQLIYGSVGALIFSLYIIYDTQMMIGGDHKYSISPEEYVFAALNLYMDIVNLFLYILTIIGATRD